MQCHEVMSTDVETVHVDHKIVDAAQIMKNHGIGFLPVVNERKQPLGTLTDRDIVLRVVAEGLDPNLRTVVDVMTLEVISCRASDDVELAAALMARNHKSRIVVVDDDDALCGVISLSDVAQLDHVNAEQTLKDVAGRETRERTEGERHASR